MSTSGVGNPLNPLSVKLSPKRIVVGIIIFLTVVILPCLSVSAYVGWNLTHPHRKPVQGNPADYSLNFQDITFPSRTDQIQCSGWYIPAPNAKSIVIEAHGYGGNRSYEKPALPLAASLVKQGISVLLFDFRDSGASQGDMVSVGDFEQRDLQGAIDYAQKSGYENIGIIGYSMGAATTAVVAAETPGIKGIVLDSPFADLQAYLETNMAVWTHLPNFPFTPLILWEIPLIAGINPAHVSPVHSIITLKQEPILFIAGDADRTIPMTNAQELWHQVQNSNDELWIVHGAKHVGAYTVEPEKYLNKVTAFFEESLK